MTPEEWGQLEAGQIIYSLSNTPRKIFKVNKRARCITLEAIRKTRYGDKYTVYTKSEARLFSLQPIPKLIKELFKKGKINRV